MKKVLAVFLAVLMLFCSASFAAVAAEGSENEFVRDFENGIMCMDSVKEITGSVTVNENETLYLDTGAKLNVYGTLTVKGKIVSRGGDLFVKYDPSGKGVGTVLHTENIITNAVVASDWKTTKPDGMNNYHFFAEIYFPNRNASEYFGLTEDAHTLSPRYMWSTGGNAYEDVDKFTENGEYVESVYGSGALNSGRIISVPLNQYLFVQSYITDSTGKCTECYDGSVITVFLNGVAMKHYGDMNCVKVTAAGAASYKMRNVDAMTGTVSMKSVRWENDDNFLKTMRIYLPSGTGYSVFGRITADGGGEISGDGQTVQLKYGKSFEFRVQIDEKYSKSDYKVFFLKGYKWDDDRYTESSFSEMAEEQKYWDPDARFIWDMDNLPEDQDVFTLDEYGYYHINEVKNEYTIMVTGVAENKTIEFAGGLMETLKNIFDAIKQFFEMLMNFFKPVA